jgi:hypothetical protein
LSEASTQAEAFRAVSCRRLSTSDPEWLMIAGSRFSAPWWPRTVAPSAYSTEPPSRVA